MNLSKNNIKKVSLILSLIVFLPLSYVKFNYAKLEFTTDPTVVIAKI